MTILGPEMGLTDLLDYEISEKLKAEAEKRKNGIGLWHPLRPSSAGHCARKLALELMEYRGKAFYNKPLIEPNIDRLFSLGHAVEYTSLKHFELVKIFQQKYKQQVVTLFTLDRGPNFEKELIEGSCDFVLWNEKYKCIGDVKSKKDGWSSHFNSKWDEEFNKIKNFPSVQTISSTALYAEDLEAFVQDLENDWLVDNLLQLNLYAMSSFMQERGIQFASVYRVNKNDSRHMEIRFKPSERMFRRVEEKFNQVAKTVDENRVDDLVCEFPFGSIRHAFCDCHKILPYSSKDPIKAFFSTLPKKVWPTDVSTMAYADPVRSLYETYKRGKTGEEEAKKAEEKLTALLVDQKISKVKFDDGAIFEVRLLKSPREHCELRRSK